MSAPRKAPPKVVIAAVRVREYSDLLDATVSRVVGYAASCECRAAFKLRRTFYAASADARQHAASHRDGE